jgi:hypothetical protein
MSSLNGNSTDAEVSAAYDDNASFEEDQSTSKAAAFVTACRILLARRPVSVGVDGRTAAFDAQAIREQLARAQRYLAGARSGGKVKHLDFSGVRD